VTLEDISPTESIPPLTDADGATGGRIHHLSSADGKTWFAASEWGGLYRSGDSGLTWEHVDSFQASAAWDVRVDPTNAKRIYATALFDGRRSGGSGLSVSDDGGSIWRDVALSYPSNCEEDWRRTQPSAFGISIDPADHKLVYVGTSCGIAESRDGGLTWTINAVTVSGGVRTVWSVQAHGGIVDACGDEGHFRRESSGGVWNSPGGLPLPGGICSSIVAAPSEPSVVFAVVGTAFFESDDSGQTWYEPFSDPDAPPTGRIPFLSVNVRNPKAFDLWVSDVGLYRFACRLAEKPADKKRPRCSALSSGGSYTRSVGGHDDVGTLAFDPTRVQDACPLLLASDGGIFRNANLKAPACHSPSWVPPSRSPRALWVYGLAASSNPATGDVQLFAGAQDNGFMATRAANAPKVQWRNTTCCDVFSIAASARVVLYTQCCYPTGTWLFAYSPSSASIVRVDAPSGAISGWQSTSVAHGPVDDFAVVSSTGVWLTHNALASPGRWTLLGAPVTAPEWTSESHFVGVKASVPGTDAHWFAEVLNGVSGARELWRLPPNGAWRKVPPAIAGRGVTVWDVDAAHPNRIIAAWQRPGQDPQMMITTDTGANWSRLASLDVAMTASGALRYRTDSGPTEFTTFHGYGQPTLLAFDPEDSATIIAGGADAGVLLSRDGGASWTSVRSTTAGSGTTGRTVTRARLAVFSHDAEDAHSVNVYLGTQGGGIWRLRISPKPRVIAASPSR
jgi:hypothetical protein